MSKINFVANSNTGQVVNQFANSESFGYAMLEGKTASFNGNRLNVEKRTCLLRGNVDELQAIVDSAPNGLGGRIRFVEITEDEAKTTLNGETTSEAGKVFMQEVHKDMAKDDWNKAVEGFKLQNPKTDEYSTHNGSHILRMKVYDPTGELADITLLRDSWGKAEPILNTADVE